MGADEGAADEGANEGKEEEGEADVGANEAAAELHKLESADILLKMV